MKSSLIGTGLVAYVLCALAACMVPPTGTVTPAIITAVAGSAPSTPVAALVTPTPSAPTLLARISLQQLPGIGRGPYAVAVLGDKIYVPNAITFNLAVIQNDRVVKFIPFGDRPPGGLAAPPLMAIDPVQKHLYIANVGDETISVIENEQVRLSKRIGAEATSLLFFEGRLYVAVANKNLILVLDPVTLENQARIAVPGAFSISTLVGDSARHRIYASLSSKVAMIDPASLRVTTLEIKGGDPMTLLASLPNNRLLIALPSASSDTTDLGVFDALSGVEQGRLQIGGAPRAVGIGADNSRAYVANSYTGDISVVDFKAMTLVATIPVGRRPVALALDENAHRLYVANQDGDNLTAIDVDTNQVIGLIPLVMMPTALVADETTGRAYVANAARDSVYVIQENRLAREVKVGRYPVAMARDPQSNRVLVANQGDGTLSIIDESDLSVRTSPPLTKNPQTIAVDTAHTRVFLGSAILGLKDYAPIGKLALEGVSQTGRVSTVEPLQLRVGPNGNRIYAAAWNGMNGSGSAYIVYSIDGDTLQTRNRLDMRFQSPAVLLDIDPKTGRLFLASNQWDKRLGVYDANDTKAISQTLPALATDMVYNPQTEHLIFSYADDTVRIVETKSFGQVALFNVNGASKMGRLGNLICIAGLDGVLTVVQDAITPIPPTPAPPTPTATATRRVITPSVRLAPSPAPVLRAGWTSYTNANHEIRAAAFDAQGNLWTASVGGAVRWNIGNGSYTKYTVEHGLAANKLSSLAVTRDGRVWFGTEGHGVTQFDGKVWKTYTQVDGLASNSVHAIATAPDGVVWFATDSGVSRFDGRTWKTYTKADGLAGAPVWSIAVARDGGVWFGTGGSGVSRFDGRVWKTYDSIDGLADNMVMAIAVAPDGAFWFGTNRGVTRFDGQTWKSYTQVDGLPDPFVTSLHVAADGTVWVGTQYGNGVSRFDGRTFRTYGIAEGLGDDRILSIASAPDGAVWVGTRYGTARFDGQTWKTYLLADGLEGDPPISDSAYIESVAAGSDGTLWFAIYGGGVSRLDGRGWKTFVQSDGLPSNNVLSVAAASDGTAWVGTDAGVARFQGASWNSFTKADGLVADAVSSIAVGTDGAVWFGTTDGISRLRGGNWQTFTERNGLADNTVHSITTAPNGQVWVSTAGGASRFDGQTWQTFTHAVGLPDDDVWSIAIAPDRAVWIATSGGVSRFDGKSLNYSTADGLANNLVFGIAVSPDGSVWARTDSGVCRFDGSTWKSFAPDGLDKGVSWVTIAPDGAVWFITASGASRFDNRQGR